MGIADRMRPKRTTVQRIRGASHLDRCRAGNRGARHSTER